MVTRLLAAFALLPGWMPVFLAGMLVAGVSAWLWNRHGSAPARHAALGQFRDTHRDPLTGLANRQCFTEALAGRLLAGQPAALLLFDLDGFAALNGAHGHRAGDEVLVAAADRLRSLVPGPGQLGRLGSDTFAVLLEAQGGRKAVEAACLNLLRAMTTPLRTGIHAAECGVSLGAALAPEHGRNADALLRAAQSALACAKQAGGGGWRFFDPARAQAEQARTALKEEFRRSLQSGGQLIPYYQPIVNLRTGALIGLEVLARWAHPARGVLAPDLFIPLAEEMQLAGLLTQTLMRRVIADARDWPAWLYFAFNASPGQLRELIGMVRNPPVWPEGALDPRRLEIEVTESAVIEDLAVAREVIALLQGQGTRVVLDDFGIGHSNFFHLRELPFDRIKIDKSFVLDIAHDPRAEACVRAMLALGQSLRVEMVAEGIESAETARFMAKLGCQLGQGYFYAEPVPAAAVHGLLRRLAAPARALAAAC